MGDSTKAWDVLVRETRVAYVGHILHTPTRGSLTSVPAALVCVGADGCIVAVLHPPPSDAGAKSGVTSDATSPPPPPPRARVLCASCRESGDDAARGPPHYDDALLSALGTRGKLRRLPPRSYLLPGMVDLHFHAPQWPLVGRGMNLPLADWLVKHAFPAERACSDLAYARRLYGALVPAVLARGTTTALYFATIHLEGSKALADACMAHGQRAFVGKVAMDNPDQCPDGYIESTKESLADTESFIKYVRGLAAAATPDAAGRSTTLCEACGLAPDGAATQAQSDGGAAQDTAGAGAPDSGAGAGAGAGGGAREANSSSTGKGGASATGAQALVQPVITPRFLPSCTDELLRGLGDLAAKYGCHVQSHCSESKWVVGYARDRFGATDAAVYDRFGLLRKHTVMAHAPYLTDEDLALFRARGAGVAHCPLSNFYYANAAFPLRRVVDAGVAVGLGTDVGGAPSACMFQSCRDAVVASKALHEGVSPFTPFDAPPPVANAAITHVEAFFAATMGGAQALGIDNVVGSIEPGKAFDAIVVQAGSTEPGADVRVFDESVCDSALAPDSIDDVFCKVVYGASRSSVATVWVQGRLVSGVEPAAAAR